MSRWFVAGLLGLSALGLGVRWAWTLAVDPEVPAVGDATAYHLLAEGIADGDGYLRPYDRIAGIDRATAEYPPLHPTVVAAAALVGVDSVTGQRLWIGVFGAVAVGVTGLLGRRLTGDERTGLLAAGLLALHPLAIQADAVLMPETLAVLLGAGITLAAVEAHRRPTARNLLVLGAVTGVGGLARSELLVLLPVLAVPIAGWRRAWVPVVAAALVLAPWALRNVVRFGTPTISDNAGSAIDGANCPATYGGQLLGYWSYSDHCFEGFTQDELAADDEATVANRHLRAGIDYATGHARRWPVVGAARIGRAWGVFRPGQQADLAVLEGRRRTPELAGYAFGWLLAAAAVAGSVELRRARRPWWIPAAVVAAATAVVAATYGNPRFLAAAMPALVVLAAAALPASPPRARPSAPGIAT